MGLVVALLTAFAGGLLLSLTPCVYPLIPITAAVVAAAGGGRSWKKGLALTLVYVTGLSLVYAAAGAAAAKAGGMLGVASRHWAVVTVMAAVFVALAFSLLDVYDLTLPAGLRAKLALGKVGGPVGVFAMGMLSGLVASPCIAGPIAAVLLHISTTGNVVLGALLLFTMAWGMSVLLIAAGTFSSFISLLPKSGGWMLAVKTVFAVVLLVASLYYLRTVLPVEAFSAWLATPLIALGVVRVLAIRVPDNASRGRKALKALGLTAVVFGIYFGVGGLVRAGMPAPGISALYPGTILAAQSRMDFRTDFAAAASEARSTGTPVVVEFTGENCPACRELESTIFSREDIAAEAQRFIAIRADVSRTPESVLNRYAVKGVPTVVWIDSRGNTLDGLRVTGARIAPEEFLRRMRAVK
jgi:thiol:disulfide interchange protein DsbD